MAHAALTQDACPSSLSYSKSLPCLSGKCGLWSESFFFFFFIFSVLGREPRALHTLFHWATSPFLKSFPKFPRMFLDITLLPQSLEQLLTEVLNHLARVFRCLFRHLLPWPLGPRPYIHTGTPCICRVIEDLEKNYIPTHFNNEAFVSRFTWKGTILSLWT